MDSTIPENLRNEIRTRLGYILKKKKPVKQFPLIKSKQDRSLIVKRRTNTSKKFKRVKKSIKANFWVLNPSDNLNEIGKKISKLRKIHGAEKYSKYIKMY